MSAVRPGYRGTPGQPRRLCRGDLRADARDPAGGVTGNRAAQREGDRAGERGTSGGAGGGRAGREVLAPRGCPSPWGPCLGRSPGKGRRVRTPRASGSGRTGGQSV